MSGMRWQHGHGVQRMMHAASAGSPRRTMPSYIIHLHTHTYTHAHTRTRTHTHTHTHTHSLLFSMAPCLDCITSHEHARPIPGLRLMVAAQTARCQATTAQSVRRAASHPSSAERHTITTATFLMLLSEHPNPPRTSKIHYPCHLRSLSPAAAAAA
jgi:hypothetical protein